MMTTFSVGPDFLRLLQGLLLVVVVVMTRLVEGEENLLAAEVRLGV